MKTRWLLFLLCGCAALSAAGQTPPPEPALWHERRVIEVPGATETVAPPVLKMPDVRLLRPDGAAVQLRRDLHHVPQFTGDGPVVVLQDPPPGADVGLDTKIVLALGVPQLSVSASTATPAVGEDVTFTAVAEPASGDIVYSFAWNDGSGEMETTDPQATHRFSAAGTYEVIVRARFNEIEMGPVSTTISPIAPPAPPAPDTADAVATVTTDTIPTIAVPKPTPPPVDTTTTVVHPAPVNPEPEPPAVPWLFIALMAAAVACAAAAALVRAVRRTPPAPSAVPPRVSIRSGLGAAEHTIEHPEQIRNGLSVRLRGGVRAAVAGEGGADV